MERKHFLRHNIKSSKSTASNIGECMNPWNAICESTDIAVYIYYRGDYTPICRECWINIASEDKEWRCN